jgi:predicted nucleic acid-binding protein
MSAPGERPVTLPTRPTCVVIDASVAIKWFVPEVHASAARRLLQDRMTLLAPDLIWAEVGNALWRKWREGELSAEDVRGILNDFRRFPLRIQSNESLYEVAWPAAQSNGRTFSDSLYLGLAMSVDCPLVTADLHLYQSLRDTPSGQHVLWIEDVV